MKLKTKDLDQSAKRALEALLRPTQILNGILRNKLRGTYKTCMVSGWKRRKDMHRINFINEFPAGCYIESKEKGLERRIVVIIKYNWDKWDKIFSKKKVNQHLEFNITDTRNLPNQFRHIHLKTLENPEFIQVLRDFLDGKRELREIPWEKWEIEHQ